MVNKELDKLIRLADELNKPLLLVGKHGSGKSYAVLDYARRRGRGIYHVILTSETTPEDLIGQKELVRASTRYVVMPLLEAVKNGGLLLIDEINVASPAILTLLNGLVETGLKHRFLNVQNKIVRPHKDFRLYATANPSEYAGTQLLSDSLLSRFLIKKVDPDFKFFLSLVDKKNRADCEKFLSAVQKVNDKQGIYISPRELINFSDLIEAGQNYSEAVNIVLGRFYDIDRASLELVQSVFEVEGQRKGFYVLNQEELQKKIDDANNAGATRIAELSKELDGLKGEVKKFEVLKEVLSDKL